MNIIRRHINSLLEKNMRLDGRKFDEFRKEIKVKCGIAPFSAEGSARVTIGGTEVIAGIKFSVGEPFPDKPGEGTIIAGVELRPLSSPDFDDGPPSIKAIELARAVVDRGIRESKCVDFKKLCIKKGEKVWLIFIDVYSINDEGNLADAMGLAALAALKDAKFPKYVDEKVVYDEKTNKKLTLEKLPIPITIIKINDKFLIDPTLEEEENADAKLTVTTTEDGNVCAMQKGGQEPLTSEDIEEMINLSIKKGKELRSLLK